MLVALILAGLGMVLSAAQDLATVERQALELSEAQPSAANWQKLGLSRYLQNKYGPASAAFRQALRLDSSLWASHLFLGVSLYRTNQFPLALTSIERADRLAPKAAQGRDDVDYWLGATQIALHQSLKGLQSLERLLARNPRHSEALQLATETYAETASGLWNGVAERAFETAPGQEVHGYAVENEGNRDAALAAFRRSRDRAPQRPGPGVAIGRLLLLSGELEAAREALTRELQLDPVSGEAHLFMGLLGLRENQPELAASSLQVAAAWLPQNEEVTHELLLTALAAANDGPGLAAEKRRWTQLKERR